MHADGILKGLQNDSFSSILPPPPHNHSPKQHAHNAPCAAAERVCCIQSGQGGELQMGRGKGGQSWDEGEFQGSKHRTSSLPLPCIPTCTVLGA